jgi:cbb3-type cytochrome oxidase maturation protein
MDSLYVLIPVTFVLLGLALGAYLWSVSSGQFEDLDKAAHSILFDDDGDTPQASQAPSPAPGSQDDAPNRR